MNKLLDMTQACNNLWRFEARMDAAQAYTPADAQRCNTLLHRIAAGLSAIDEYRGNPSKEDDDVFWDAWAVVSARIAKEAATERRMGSV